jgi:hypothetical protein
MLFIFLQAKKQLWSSQFPPSAGLTSSEYHYSSFSELPYLLYSKNSSIFAKQKQNPALPFQKNVFPTLPLPAGRFSANTLLGIKTKNVVFP